MGYRKFAADQLFTGHEMLAPDVILITDDNGRIIDLADAEDAGDNVERFNGIISPGFINCHCHLELSHMKGKIPSATGMIRFLLTVLNDRNIAEEQIQDAIRFEEQYMFEKGIVAVGDICNTTHTISVKNGSSIYFHNFVEATGFLEANAELRFRQARDVYDEFFRDFPASSIVPHAPYSVSDKLFSLINDFHEISLLSIHNQESEAESEFFAYATGGFLELYRSLNIDIGHFKGGHGSSLKHCLRRISPTHSLILVHNVHTSEDDLRWLSTTNNLPALYWCLCPNANLYINDQLPDVNLLKKYNCRIVVGTDSVASNLQLNVLEELKTLQLNFDQLATEELLAWATLNGAIALGIASRFGSFEKGKQPGVVNVDGGKDGSLAGAVARRIL